MKLKPCSCGSTRAPIHELGGYHDWHAVRCGECGYKTAMITTQDGAIEQWNRWQEATEDFERTEPVERKRGLWDSLMERLGF